MTWSGGEWRDSASRSLPAVKAFREVATERGETVLLSELLDGVAMVCWFNFESGREECVKARKVVSK